MNSATPALALEHVTKSYSSPAGSRTDVLTDVNLTVVPGEAVAIIGPSGCGKSTLLNVIGALDRVSSGTIKVHGRELQTLDDRQLATLRNRNLGYIFQMHHLLPQCTILENVLVPTIVNPDIDRAAAIARARQLLDRVELSHRLAHRPGQLSGGEQQRVAVVRALINSPTLVLADEPTGSLDRKRAAALVGLLKELNRAEQVTVVMVTHAMELASRFGRTLELRDGALHPVEAQGRTTA